MHKPRICGVITNSDLAVIDEAGPSVDLFELRLDLIGDSWPKVAESINKPWIATCRLKTEGGAWHESEARRKEVLLKACQSGATMVDLELATPNLKRLVPLIKHKARLIISYHNFKVTPTAHELRRLAARQFDAGADIAKISTWANGLDDNINLLNLAHEFHQKEVIITSMGEKGIISRILSPLAGSAFTFVSVKKGFESAEGQLTAPELRQIYSSLEL